MSDDALDEFRGPDEEAVPVVHVVLPYEPGDPRQAILMALAQLIPGEHDTQD